MKSLPRLLPFIKPYRWIVVLLFFTVVLPVAMELAVPIVLRYVIDDGILQMDMQAIWQGVWVMLAAALVGAIATLGQGFSRAWLSQGFAFDLRNTLFAHVQTFSFGNLDKIHTGQIMTRLSSDVDVVRMFSSHGISLLLRATLMIIGSTVMIMLIDWQLALVTLAFMPLAAIIIAWVIRKAQPLFLIVQHKLSSLNTLVQENLAGVEVVKAFAREPHEIEQFGVVNVDYMAQHIRVGKLLAIALPALTLVTNLGIVVLVWVGGLSVIGGRLTVGELVAFNSYLMIGMAPMMLLSNMLTLVSRADASAQRVSEVLDTEPVIRPALSPHQSRMTGHVAFENVSFAYDDGEGETVLDGVSFTVEPGQQVALMGATGSGKSTLVNLIPRFYDVTGGSINIDGVDVRQWSSESLREQIGMVMQQTTLFSGTVRENIAYGRPDATLDEVIAAAQAAQAHEFISAMPDGYDSIVEARGANLSGGQRQRVAIARALLINPSILIFDDSTSAVDLDTEFHIQQALQEQKAGCTTFIVAQRINSVLNADQILVLDRGHIVAQGAHRELMDTSTIYREIYESQLGGDTPPTLKVTPASSTAPNLPS